MSRVRRRGTAYRSVILTLAVSTLSALFVPSIAGGATIAQTQAQIAALSARLAKQQRIGETTANAYDAAKVELSNIEANITVLKRKEANKRTQLAATSIELQRAVVRAYVYGAASTQAIALFDQNVTTSDARQVFQDQVVGDLTSVRDRYQSQKVSLDHTMHQVAVQKSNAVYQTNRMRSLLAQNAANESATRATLAVVTERLKKEIIAYEITVGAAAARNRDVAKEEAAVAAASAVGGQAAANLVLQAIQKATPTTYAGSPAGSKQGMAALHWAETQIGVPYVWGGETPGKGFDCSGLVQWAWAKAGFTIPRTTETQWPALHHVPLTALQPGDLLYYYNLDGDHLVDHVVMYAGSGPWGTSTIIAAAHSGTNVSLAPMFTFGLIGAARP